MNLLEYLLIIALISLMAVLGLSKVFAPLQGGRGVTAWPVSVSLN